MTFPGYDYRPCTSHFALLTRSFTHDVVSIHQNTSYRISSTFTLPTIDAQGLKWSPCGRWLAVWDSATSGYKVLIYTADGHLYRTHQKDVEGLGVKTVEWSPGGDFLTIGGYDGKLCFLNNYTFSPVRVNLRVISNITDSTLGYIHGSYSYRPFVRCHCLARRIKFAESYLYTKATANYSANPRIRPPRSSPTNRCFGDGIQQSRRNAYCHT